MLLCGKYILSAAGHLVTFKIILNYILKLNIYVVPFF